MRVSLTKRYVLFVAGVTVVLLAVSYGVTFSVVRGGLTEQFRNRLDRSRTVVQQYEQADLLNRGKEIQTIVSSPRFVAALATGDSATIGAEAPAYQALTGADLFLAGDQDGQVLFRGGRSVAAGTDELRALLLRGLEESLTPQFVVDSGSVLLVLSAPVVTADGYLIGLVAVGHEIGAYVPEELKQLTGFDVVISHRGEVVGATEAPLVGHVLADPQGTMKLFRAKMRADEIELDGETVLYESVPFHSGQATFVASVDDHISPIMAEITSLLVIVAVLGGLLAMAAIYIFTQRRIGRPVNLLVNAAQRIAKEDFAFAIESVSQDELGYLAREFERTRAGLLIHREELEKEHEGRVKAQRMAAIGRLTAGIVHDIKNPMAVIRSSADLMQHFYRNDEKLARRCAEIQEQVDRVNALTMELLEYSRGNTKLDLLEVPITEYIDEVRDAHSDVFVRADIDLEVDGGEAVVVRVDPMRFRRVLDNLLNNAREALGAGMAVRISWVVSGLDVTVYVADTGPGIPENIRATIFDPFVTQGKQTGTGLGLAITRRIVEDHGGSITVESEPGRGSTFSITLRGAVVAGGQPEQVTSKEELV